MSRGVRKEKVRVCGRRKREQTERVDNMFKEKINQSLYEKLLISISLCRVESEKNLGRGREKLKGVEEGERRCKRVEEVEVCLWCKVRGWNSPKQKRPP